METLRDRLLIRYYRDKISSHVDFFPALTGAYLGGVSGALLAGYLHQGGTDPESIRRRRRSIWLGAGLGALKGGFTGHYLIPRWMDKNVSRSFREHSYPEVIGAGALVGGGYGAGAGAVVGGPVGAVAGALPGAALGGATNIGYKFVADHSRFPIKQGTI